MLLIKNGRVLDPASKTDGVLDVLLDGEKITELGPSGKLLAPQGTEVFDASGLIVAPGFIDIHVHLREPGQESSETIETGTRAAARGGFTAVCCMPNTKPVNDSASVARKRPFTRAETDFEFRIANKISTNPRSNQEAAGARFYRALRNF